MLNIVLVEPEIPQNTGNIARTCAATGARLHLVKPLGFDIDDKKLKRAGLDYWDMLDITFYENMSDFYDKNPDGRFFYCTTKARHNYDEMQYKDGDYFVFGKETKGLDEALLKENPQTCIRIPMVEGARSLNLSNSVAVIVYEGLRQNKFVDLQKYGELTKYKW